MSGIPSDLRQFHLRHLVWMSLSVCVSAGVIRWDYAVGWWVLFPVLLFWTGYGLMFLSDVIDPRVINDRVLISKLLSALGALVTVLGCIFFWFLILKLIFVLIHYLSR